MTKLSTATAELPALSLTAARLALGAAASFLALILLLHAVKPDIDPSWRFISEYAIGEHGWILRLAFVSLATACIALGAVLRPDLRTIPGRIGLAGLVLMAAGLAIAAVFTTDPITTPSDAMTTTGKVHALGGALGMGMPVANVLITWTLIRHPRWSRARVPLLLSGALAIVGTLVFIGALAILVPPSGRFGPEVPVGWPNRLEALAMSIWLMTVARHAAALARARTALDATQSAGNIPAAAA